MPPEPSWAVHQCVVLVLHHCGSTESEQKSDKDGDGVVLSVVGMVDKQRGNE